MKSVTVLFITRSDPSLASSRVRVFDLLPYLKQEGVHGRALIKPRKKNFFKQLGFLFKFVWHAPRHDIIVLQKVMPSTLFSRLARLLSRVLVFDIDDAMHELHPSMKDDAWAKQRHAVGLPRLQFLLRKADAVFCGNEHLACYANLFNRNIEIIPSCIDSESYARHTRPNQKCISSPIIFGWIGHGQNLVDFEPIKDALRETLRELQGRGILRIVSSRPIDIEGIDAEYVPWSIENQFEAMSNFDVGLMPLVSDARSLGRCGYKAIQYMGLGLPVVASPVGDAGQVVEHGVTGYHACDATQWREALLALARSSELRQSMGQAGQQRAEREYSYQAWAPRIAIILRRLLTKPDV